MSNVQSPNFEIEKNYWDKGFVVIGVDDPAQNLPRAGDLQPRAREGRLCGAGVGRPDFEIEKIFWRKGYVVVGVDEVGRGAVAGPVVAAAAAIKCTMYNVQCIKKIEKLGIDDSKKLSRNKREELTPLIKKYFYWGIGEASALEINKFGIVKATGLAMKRSLRDLRIKKTIILIDGRHVKGIGHQEAIVKGDQKSISIAAASIIAKVYRDGLMRDLSGKYPGYGFERHVGYGTKKHVEMIKKLGVSKMHRTMFVRSLLKTSSRRGFN